MKFNNGMYFLYFKNSIERRYVAHAGLRQALLASEKTQFLAHVDQGFISLSPTSGIYLSKVEKPREKPRYSMTIKDPKDPEYWIEQFIDSKAVYDALVTLTNGKNIKMKHYYHAEPGTCMTFDDFGGSLDKLCLVRFTFSQPSKADSFAPPVSMQAELTEVSLHPAYQPTNLMCRPALIDCWPLINPQGNPPYDTENLIITAE